MKSNRKAKIDDLKLIGALMLTALTVMHGVRLLIIVSLY